MLQCVAVCRSMPKFGLRVGDEHVLQCCAGYFSVMQLVVKCCGALQCGHVGDVCCNVLLQRVVCVLQRVAARSTRWLCVGFAVCCDVLQYVAVCCSEFTFLHAVDACGVATISRFLKSTGLFCKRAL